MSELKSLTDLQPHPRNPREITPEALAGLGASIEQYGDAIFDPFAGSGTTIVAAEPMSRRCYAMEIEPRYVDVAVRRWEQFTGLLATLEKGEKT